MAAIAACAQTWKNREAAGSAATREKVMAANELPPREAMEFDVVIVGAGPAGQIGRAHV